ncbi:hypothetical protein BC833DRAFT_623593 [Globomyces pollinis-pini]|nr:hypothetical protein BC833DRAFT_623593 [Globomyces pollinis-pini]
MILSPFLFGVGFLFRYANALGDCEAFCGFYSGLKSVGGVCNAILGGTPTSEELEMLDCCSFNSVDCDPSKPVPSITSINLSRFATGITLKGTITEYVSQFTSLRSLDLRSNQISGQIDSISFPESLETILLSANWISGELPQDFSYLTNLKTLDISGNQLTGGINNVILPVSIQVLDLGLNYLSGDLPKDLSGLTNLISIYLASNQFTGGIDTIILPESLQSVELGDNKLSGELPQDLSSLINLKILGLATNRFTGEISNIVFPTSISIIDFGDNQLSGDLPPDLSGLTDLEYLILSRNQFTGRIDNILLPAALYYLDLANNTLVGEIPQHINGLASLNFIDMSYNDLSGGIPQDLSGLTSLEYLYLRNNRLNGTIENIAYPEFLSILDLSANQLTGGLPQDFTGLIHLLYLNLKQNQLYGRVDNITIPIFGQSNILISERDDDPAPFGFWYLYDKLDNNFSDLSENSFYGKLPDNLEILNNLLYLDVSSNNLSGKIDNVKLPVSLTWLDLGNNFFSGQIPQDFSQFINLRNILLYDNQLNGSIDELVFPKSLVRLDLNNNSLSGGLTQDLSTFPRITYIDLSYNNLNMTLDSIKLPRSIKYLNLQSNKLTGKIPKSFANATVFPFLTDLILRNNQLDGFFHGKETFKYCDIRGNNVCDPLEPSPCFMERCFDGSKICDIALALNSSFTCTTSNNYCKDETQDWYKCDENDKVISINITNGRFKHQDQEIIVAPNATISNGLFSMQNLKTLVLSGNALNISLITGIDLLSKLTYIDLSNNLFYGSITSSYINLKELTHLDLSNNLLGFGIPKGFANLTYLKLSGNKFTGKFKQSFTGSCEIIGPEISVCDPSTSGNPSCGLRLCSSISFIERYENLQQQYQNLVGRFKKVNSLIEEFIATPINESPLRDSFPSEADLYKYVLDVFVAYTNVQLFDTNGDDALNILTVGNVALNLGQLLQDFSDVSGVGFSGAPNGGIFGNGDFSSSSDPQGGTGGFPGGGSDFIAKDYIVSVNQTNPAIPVSGSNGLTQTVVVSSPTPMNAAVIGSDSNVVGNVVNSVASSESNTNVANFEGSDGDSNGLDANGVALKIDKSDATKMAGSAVIAGGLGLAMLL